MAEMQEELWEDLLEYVQDRAVIPVIGSELVTIREGDQEIPLVRWLAGRLAANLQLPFAELPAGFDLNEVVALHLRRGGERWALYSKIDRLLRDPELKPNESLRALAGIPGFNLFVSLTFDSLLAEALGATVDQIVYARNTPRDLVRPKAALQQPVVFHLLGQASSRPDYAICDEDLLEFLYRLGDKNRLPHLLFDELLDNHLLILGCGYGDWLARFFLRHARNLEFSERRRYKGFLVDKRMAEDSGLMLFLESFCGDCRVIPLSTAEFVAELARRWRLAHSPEARNVGSVTPAVDLLARKGKTWAIFVSYASEDVEAARRLVEELRAADLEPWFEESAVPVGEDLPRSIQRALRNSSLFLPIISRNSVSESNFRRNFWKEWRHADRLASGFAPREGFVVPVLIDDTRIDDSVLPDSFKEKKGITSALGGHLTPEAIEQLKALIKSPRQSRHDAA